MDCYATNFIMDQTKLVDYSDSSSDEDNFSEIPEKNLDLTETNGNQNYSVNVNLVKKIAVVSPIQQREQGNAANVSGHNSHIDSSDDQELDELEDLEINTQSPISVHSNYDIIEIPSSPVESPNIIDVSSESDTTIPYVNPLEEENDPYLEFDEVFSIKSCTTGNKNHNIFLHESL